MNIRTNSDGSISVLDDSGRRLIDISGNQVSVNVPGGDVHIGDDGTKDLILSATETVFTKFIANQPEHWEGEPPKYEWDAINRLASACAALGKKP